MAASFSSRNPIVIGVVSLVVIVGLLVVAYNVDALPLIGAGTEYRAQFAESSDLSPGNEVRIAGVKVGKVTSVSLEGTHVLVTFRTKADLGDQSTASIQIKTLLGQKYLALDPAGAKALDPNTPIPLDRTVSPYDVVQAFNQLSTTVNQLNTQQLADSLRTLADTFRDTPPEVRASLDGLSRLSVTISSRNQQLAHLLDNANKTTALLAARNEDINAILSNGTKLLDELRYREAAIHQLLDGTRRLSEQLRGLVRDNQDQIGRTLDELDQLTALLQRHEDDLVAGLRRIGPFATVFTNALGNGRWFDSYIAGLIPATPLTASQGGTVPTPASLLPNLPGSSGSSGSAKGSKNSGLPLLPTLGGNG